MILKGTIMHKWMTGIRGALMVVLLWVFGWGIGFGGIMELIDRDGQVQDVWPTVLAVPGFIGGIIFAAALLVVDRKRSFADVPLVRHGIWGAVTGFILGLLSIPAEVGDVSPGAGGMIGLGILLGTIAGLGTWAFFRLFAKRTA